MVPISFPLKLYWNIMSTKLCDVVFGNISKIYLLWTVNFNQTIINKVHIDCRGLNILFTQLRPDKTRMKTRMNNCWDWICTSKRETARRAEQKFAFPSNTRINFGKWLNLNIFSKISLCGSGLSLKHSLCWQFTSLNMTYIDYHWNSEV